MSASTDPAQAAETAQGTEHTTAPPAPLSVSDLSDSSQNYLKAIWSLSEWSDDPVTTTMVAARTGVALSSASDAMRRLASQGLVNHSPHSAISLTDAGRAIAVTMVRRHRLIESFLVKALSYRWDQVHDEAENLEHAVSDFMVEQIAKLLGNPDRDPHGDPIPAADGTLPILHAVRLSEIEPGAKVRVERISDDDSDMLQFFADNGIVLDAVLETKAAAPYSDALEVTILGSRQSLSLGRSATDAVWVSLQDA